MKSKSYTWKTVAILSSAIGLLSTQLSAEAFTENSDTGVYEQATKDPGEPSTVPLSGDNTTTEKNDGSETPETSNDPNADDGIETTGTSNDPSANNGSETTEISNNLSTSEPTTEEAVPEPLSILGTGAAFGLGVYFKRKRDKSKNQA